MTTYDAQEIWDLARRPAFEGVLALQDRLGSVQLTGVRYVRQAMEMLTGRAPWRAADGTADPYGLHQVRVAKLLIVMAGAEMSTDERTALIGELRSWPLADRQSALALSVAAGTGVDPLFELVGQGDAIAMARILRRGTASSPAPEVGALDLAEIRTAAAALGTLSIDELCEALGESAGSIVDRLTGGEVRRGVSVPSGELVKAALGLNRDEVTRRVAGLSHDAIRAYGLLPLAEGEGAEDRLAVIRRSLERVAYLRFRESRWRNHLEASRCAVAHLAQVAADGEVARLVAAEDGGFVPSGSGSGSGPGPESESGQAKREWEAGAYRIGLEPVPGGGGVAIVVWRGRMRLKHTPKVLYGSAALGDARLAQAALTRWG